MRESKYSVLAGYRREGKFVNIINTWMALQCPVINADTNSFVKDLIYRVDVEIDSVLAGCFVMCMENLYSEVPLWGTASVPSPEPWDAGFVVFNANIMSPHFRLVLTHNEYESNTEPLDPNWTPWEKDTTNDSQVFISDEELRKILLPLGVPFKDVEELPFSRADICDLMIGPAMERYFLRFPIMKTTEHACSTRGFKIEMPSGAYGVTQVSFKNNRLGLAPHLNSGMSLPMMGGGYGYGGWRGNQRRGFADTDRFTTQILAASAAKAKINVLSRDNWGITQESDPTTGLTKKYLEGFSNHSGSVEITWAYASLDWRDIPFERIIDLRTVASANVMEAIARLYSQERTDIPGRADYSSFLSDAKEMKAAVFAKWAATVVPGVIRGGGT